MRDCEIDEVVFALYGLRDAIQTLLKDAWKDGAQAPTAGYESWEYDIASDQYARNEVNGALTHLIGQLDR